MAQKFTFGKNAIIRIARILPSMIAADGSVTKPPAGAFLNFCLPKEVTIGSEWGTTDIESFCTGGQTIKVRDGSKTGTLNLGESNWVRDDPAMVVMRAAAAEEAEDASMVYAEVLPEGYGAGKLAYDFVVQVNKWEMKIPAKGLITATYDLGVLEGPTERELSGTEGEATVLNSGQAVQGVAGSLGSVTTYSITTEAGGTLAVALAGGTGNADLRVKAPDGTVAGSSSKPDNAETVDVAATVAGTYTVEVLGTAAYDAATLTATFTPKP